MFTFSESAELARLSVATLRFWARRGYLAPITIVVERRRRMLDKDGVLALSLMVWLATHDWPPRDAMRAVEILMKAGRFNTKRPKREAWLLRDGWQVHLFEGRRALFARVRQIGSGHVERVDHFLRLEDQRIK